VVALQFGETGLVLFRLHEVQQFQGIGYPGGDPVELDDYRLEPRTLPPQFLGTLGRVPDAGVLQLAVYLLEPFLLVLVFKGTPSAPTGAARGLSNRGVGGRIP